MSRPFRIPSFLAGPDPAPLRVGFVVDASWLDGASDRGKVDQRVRFDEVRSFLGELYGPDLHAKRIDSLAGATLGVMAAASLAAAGLQSNNPGRPRLAA